MFLLKMISVLLITITFYTYLANIIFSCDLDFNLISYTTIHWKEITSNKNLFNQVQTTALLVLTLVRKVTTILIQNQIKSYQLIL